MIRRTASRFLPVVACLALAACATQAPPSAPVAAATPPPSPAQSTTLLPPVPQPPERPLAPPSVTDPAIPQAQRIDAFVDYTASTYGVDPQMIRAELAQAVFKQNTITAISRPAEAVRPWRDYRPIFLTDARIDGGKAFYAANRDALERVAASTGVPAEYLVAIIGVETSYGKNAGSHRVLDALYTLAFYYPRSGDPAKLEREVRRELFFRDELAKLFELGREEKLDITTLKGSYAGAMGMGQFMPSSYLDYAVDGNGDGRRDLFTSYDDVFSSIANYFVKKGGWVRGGQVAVPATLAAGREEFNPTEWMPTWSLADLAQRGYQPSAPVQPGATATPITLEGSTGKQYWLGFQNYYAITRYNLSKMYAMAVFQLSQAIAGQELPPA
jgi:membrane-bound lytic murein transglycosylase B